MILAELGADVVRIDRPGGSGVLSGQEGVDLFNRGKSSALLDLKRPDGLEAVRSLIDRADVLIEGYRPGVAEKLGVGPDDCFARNPRLVYARMTGWGQTGPRAQSAGHDLTYIALTGALDSIGPAGGPPSIPLNLVGDFGGGSTYLVIGILAAMFEANRSGSGQVVDAAIVDGAAHLMAAVHMLTAAGVWHPGRGTNILDGGAPYYSVYRTSDDSYMAIGAIENRFYAAALIVLGVDLDPARQDDRDEWPRARAALQEAFASRTRDEWTALFRGTDACVAPVLSVAEAVDDDHLAARGTLERRDGIIQAAPAPRFSRTATTFTSAPPLPGADTAEVFARWKGSPARRPLRATEPV